jgi:hypothetical protein
MYVRPISSSLFLSAPVPLAEAHAVSRYDATALTAVAPIDMSLKHITPSFIGNDNLHSRIPPMAKLSFQSMHRLFESEEEQGIVASDVVANMICTLNHVNYFIAVSFAINTVRRLVADVLLHRRHRKSNFHSDTSRFIADSCRQFSGVLEQSVNALESWVRNLRRSR